MSKVLLKDPKLRPLVETIELPELRNDETVYFSLSRSIVSQQLSTKAAATIFTRFLEFFPYNTPDPNLLLDMEIEQLRTAGLSRQKSQYLKNIAERSLEDQWHTLDWSAYDDKAAIDYLTQIKGVGVWTAQMTLMFTLKRPDIFPVGDLGIQQAMKRLYEMELEGKELLHWMESVASNWSPQRTLASRYLWRWKDQ